MNEQENAGVLTYTTESRGFKYESGAYQLTGNKVIKKDSLSSIDGGNILKNGIYIGSYYVRGELGAVRISITDVPQSEFETVYNLVNDLIIELAE